MVESAQAFTFDRVFDPTEGQKAVFDEVARPIVDGALCGAWIAWISIGFGIGFE